MKRFEDVTGWVHAITWFLIAVAITVWSTHRINDLETELVHKNEQVLEKQVKYEEARDEAAKLQRDLADAEERLAAAAERERAARVRENRASRTRNMVSSERGNLSDKQRSTASGPLRDITMYCPTGNRTASGKVPREGMVATISRSIPFGTRVQIDGLGTYVVEDRIGHSSEFDIFTPSCGEAVRFGRQHRRVTIVG